jgi:hypothetical protein
MEIVKLGLVSERITRKPTRLGDDGTTEPRPTKRKKPGCIPPPGFCSILSPLRCNEDHFSVQAFTGFMPVLASVRVL